MSKIPESCLSHFTTPHVLKSLYRQKSKDINETAGFGPIEGSGVGKGKIDSQYVSRVQPHTVGTSWDGPGDLQHHRVHAGSCS